MTDVFKLIEDHGLTLHGDIEHFAELVRAEAEKQEQKTPLKVLGLTVFTENRLRNGRVYDVETLQAMTNRDILAIPDMGKKALKEVLEALDAYASDMSQERVDETAKREHEFEEMVKKGTKAWADTPDDWVDELRGGAERQEPVAWMCEANSFHSAQWKPALAFEKTDAECFRNWKPLYAKPQSCTEVGTNSGVLRKEWVGLTDDEIDEAVKSCNTVDTYKYFRAIEAKLKEKNT